MILSGGAGAAPVTTKNRTKETPDKSCLLTVSQIPEMRALTNYPSQCTTGIPLNSCMLPLIAWFFKLSLDTELHQSVDSAGTSSQDLSLWQVSLMVYIIRQMFRKRNHYPLADLTFVDCKANVMRF